VKIATNVPAAIATPKGVVAEGTLLSSCPSSLIA
jgi:hypothetical protein